MMRLGNAAWGLRETPLAEQLKITQAMNLDLLELSIAGYDRNFLQLDATDAQIAEVRKLFAEHGISPECGCTGNDFTGDDVAEQIQKVKRVIEIAAAVGVKKLRIFGGFSSDSVVWGKRFDTMVAALQKVAEYAATYGILPVVETHGGVTANGEHALVHFQSATTRIDLWDAILTSGVGINYDPANLAAVGACDPMAFYTRFRERIAYVHLKDFRSVPGGVWPAACGEGRLDWAHLAETMKDYSGPALIEYELPGDVEDGLRRSLEYLKKIGL